MQCKKCGNNFEGNFCPNCGEKVNVVNESFKEVPVKPKPVNKPQYKKGDHVEMINRFTRKKMRLAFCIMWIILGFVQLILLYGVVLRFDLNYAENYILWEMFKLYLSQFIILAILVVAEFIMGYVLIGKYCLKKRDENKCCKTWVISLAQIIGFVVIVLSIIGVVVTFISPTRVIGNLSAVGLIILTPFSIVMICYCRSIKKLAKKIRVVVYGNKKAKANDPVVTSFKELNKDYLAYVTYKKELRLYKYYSKLYEKKKAKKDILVRFYESGFGYVKTGGTVLVSILLFGIILISTANYFNKFSASSLKKAVEFGFNKSYFKLFFGTPDVGEEDDLAWYYYENSYLNLLNKIENLDEKMESVTSFSELESLEAEYEKLEEQLESLVYKSLNVNFGEYGSLDSIWFNTKTTASYSSSNDKTLSSYDVIRSSVSRSNLTATIRYEATYTDGSYAYVETDLILSQEVVDNAESSIDVTWSDMWGSFEATISL